MTDPTEVNDLTDLTGMAASTGGGIPPEWVRLAPFDDLPVERGVAFLVEGQAIAVFRLSDGTLAALDHYEPFTGAPVLARGLVGSTADRAWVASPLHKQRFDLRSGQCLDDDAVTIQTWPIHDIDGVVHVAKKPKTA